MAKKVTGRHSKEFRFSEIEAHLMNAGRVGMRVAGVARAIQKSKSYTHKLLLEMVDAGLIEREITYTNTDHFYVNYVYYQLALWNTLPKRDDWDGITGECTMCGMDKFTSNERCSACEQEWNG